MLPRPEERSGLREDEQMPTQRIIVTLLLAALALGSVACEDEITPRRRPEARPSPTATVEGVPGCPGSERSATDPARRAGGEVEADIDGDGAPDTVWIAHDPEAEPDCTFLLVAETEPATLVAPLEEDGLAEGPTPPGLAGAYEIDGRAGNEVVLRLISGASTEFFGLYSAGSGELERLGVRDGEFGDLFPAGGSVGHLESSDCGALGSVVIATAVPVGDRYVVRRAAFTFDGKSFVPDSALSGRELVDEEDLAAGEVDGFASLGPFGSCRTD
jgi:hypothetical protein